MTAADRPAASDATDWPAQAADTIERVVGTVRDHTTGVAATIARWVVYGTFALLLGTVLAVLLAIAAVRFLDVYLPSDVWAAHLVVGSVFSALGMFAWSRRTATATD